MTTSFSNVRCKHGISLFKSSMARNKRDADDEADGSGDNEYDYDEDLR